jgi:signal transduction histidine kinase
MDQLILDLLSLARFSHQPIRKRSVSIAGLIGSILDDILIEHEGQNIKVKMGEMPICQADPILLSQVFINLLGNAIKYSRSRELISIEVGCIGQASEGEPTFFVKDNGIGFDLKYLNKIFDVFERLHSADEYEGTGLGLAIVERVIERHGGRVWAESEINMGSTFFFTLGQCMMTDAPTDHTNLPEK